MKINKLLKLIIAAAMIMGIVVSAFAGGNQEKNEAVSVKEGKYGGVLKIASHLAIPNPGYTPEATSNSTLQFTSLSYEALIQYDKAGNIAPLLATSWVTDPDEPSITWSLREGVQFSDGETFNAAVVKRNIEEYQSVGRNETQNIAECVIIDDYKVKMVLKEWFSSTLEAVGFYVQYMSPKALGDVDATRRKTVGTGPFILESYNQNVYYRYVKNENYWQEGKPYLDAVEVNVVDDDNTLSLAFQNGEYDIIIMENMTVAQQLMNAGLYVMETNKSGRGLVGTGLIPNSVLKGPFQDAKVRQAMCYAIDAPALVKAFGYGLMEGTNQWAAPNAITYNPDVKGYPYNPEKAKELLAEAGYPNGFDTKLYTPNNTKDMFTAAANMLTEVGIRATVELIDEPTNVNFYSTGTWDGIMGHYHSISPDLGLFMGRHLDPEAPYYAPGIQHPQDALDLLHDIRVARTEEEKVALEWKLQEVVYDKYALFGQPVYIQNSIVFKYDKVKDDNLNINHVYVWDPENTWLSE